MPVNATVPCLAAVVACPRLVLDGLHTGAKLLFLCVA